MFSNAQQFWTIIVSTIHTNSRKHKKKVARHIICSKRVSRVQFWVTTEWFWHNWRGECGPELQSGVRVQRKSSLVEGSSSHQYRLEGQNVFLERFNSEFPTVMSSIDLLWPTLTSPWCLGPPYWRLVGPPILTLSRNVSNPAPLELRDLKPHNIPFKRSSSWGQGSGKQINNKFLHPNLEQIPLAIIQP